MRKLCLVALCLAIATPALAVKARRVPRIAQAPLAPLTVTITSVPLTVVIGGDTSMQVYNSNVPGTGQFYPPDCGAGETADYGVFAEIPSGGGVVYGPDFDNHPCGSASNTYTPWTPVSLSAVTGTGTAGDPFTVVVVADAGATGLRLTATYTYVIGSPTVVEALVFSNQGNAIVNTDVFSGADLYLADNDDGFATLQGTSAGGHGASASCAQLQYTILFLGTTPASRWAGRGYSTIWSEISAGQLSDVIESNLCEDNGAAIQWTNVDVPVGGATAFNTGVTFTGQAIPGGPTVAVPTLSVTGLSGLILLIAVVGYVLARRVLPGA